MADEPSAPNAPASDAHECNGGSTELLLTTSGVQHLLSVVGTIGRAASGEEFVYTFAAELYSPLSKARHIDAIMFALAGGELSILWCGKP